MPSAFVVQPPVLGSSRKMILLTLVVDVSVSDVTQKILFPAKVPKTFERASDSMSRAPVNISLTPCVDVGRDILLENTTAPKSRVTLRFEGSFETCQEGGRMHSGKIFLICSNGYRWIAVLIRMPYITLMLI